MCAVASPDPMPHMVCSGALLAASMGPKYQVSRELDIPVGSMTIPQVGQGTKDRKMHQGPWPNGLGMPASHGMRIGSYTHCVRELAGTPSFPSPIGSDNLFLPTSYTQDARELVVIVDTRSDRQRLVAAVGFSFLLMAAVSRMS